VASQAPVCPLITGVGAKSNATVDIPDKYSDEEDVAEFLYEAYDNTRFCAKRMSELAGKMFEFASANKTVH